jgi:hypothetical protein
VAPLALTVEVRQRQGRGALGATGAGNGSGRFGEVWRARLWVSAPAQGHWRVAVHDEATRWRRNLTPASNHIPPMADKRKIGSGLGWLPREKDQGRLSDGEDTARALVDGDRALATRGEGQ